MLGVCMETFVPFGRNTLAAELTHTTFAEDNQYRKDIVFDGQQVQRAPRNGCFEVPGTSATSTKRFNVELQRRIRVEWATWWRFEARLCHG